MMKCAKIRLQERSKLRDRNGRPKETGDRVRRFCQKRMVDPGHGADPRWNEEVIARSHCEEDLFDLLGDSQLAQDDSEDLFLSVQTLKFQGDVQERKRPRTCFKYKSLTNGIKHRMFVKQNIEDQDKLDVECSSQQTNDYFDDYVKYILNSDRSRPSTGKSSICHGIAKENKVIQEEFKSLKSRDTKTKEPPKKSVRLERENENETRNPSDADTMSDAKISFHRSGKRKSLTISRTQSPETVQVIRVDVVCNCSSADSTISEFEEKKPITIQDTTKNNKELSKTDLRNNPYANKYLLTKTIKTLDENVSGGAKVTLLCKTFRLSDRNKKRNVQRPSGNNMLTFRNALK